MSTQNVSSILDNPDHTFVIAEAGSNWVIGSKNENLDMAKKLIEIASFAGADAVKFQTFKSKSMYAKNSGQIDYLKNQSKKSINSLIDELSMPYEILGDLSDHCKKHDILFMSTPFAVSDAKEVNKYVPIHKIASFEINHIRLLEFLAKTKKPILISTGASSYEEIDFAVNLMNQNHCGKLYLLQCTSKYPAPVESLNISAIPKIKSHYNLPVGFSDHSIDPFLAPLLAIGFGASIIEKHFTLDRNLPGPDHTFSIVPNELQEMIQLIRLADKSKGNGKKIILNDEQELHDFATRSIQAIKDIQAGEILQEGVNFDSLRPGNNPRGEESRYLLQMNGMKTKKNYLTGNGIKLDDLTD